MEEVRNIVTLKEYICTMYDSMLTSVRMQIRSEIVHIISAIDDNREDINQIFDQKFLQIVALKSNNPVLKLVAVYCISGVVDNDLLLDICINKYQSIMVERLNKCTEQMNGAIQFTRTEKV